MTIYVRSVLYRRMPNVIGVKLRPIVPCQVMPMSMHSAPLLCQIATCSCFFAGMANTAVRLFDTGVRLFDFVRLFGCSNEGYGLFGSVRALFSCVHVRLCSCSEFEHCSAVRVNRLLLRFVRLFVRRQQTWSRVGRCSFFSGRKLTSWVLQFILVLL